MDYNATLCLPKTDFPMRAGLPAREPGMLDAWDGLYEKIIAANEGKPRFVLHDGPPFSNGEIHMGHALNKLTKDFIVRYKNISGFQAPYIPGWDNHGMPIESAIIKQNKLDRKKMSVAEFRAACHEFAQGWIDKQREGFKRLGILGEWDAPYMTMAKSFEALEVKVFGAMFEKGYIYKGLKPVYWCPKDETSLAEAEIEYKDDPCTSIYVKFAENGRDKVYFVAWTTTPWTLPGNLALCLNAEFDYAELKLENGDVYIVASDLIEAFAKDIGLENYIVAETHKGSHYENRTFRHPFLERDGLVILGEHVTLEAGTGVVHTAPGHGMEDFIACKAYKLDVVVPVDARGIMTDEAGIYGGMHYSKANEQIVTDLEAAGKLAGVKSFTHQYPHCWRCGNPIIYRATEQWFCSVDSFKEQAAEACNDVEWLNSWGEGRMLSMLRDRADWCISRQRRWGLPIPVFYCDDCGKPVCNDETIEYTSIAFEEFGSNAWFDDTTILPEGYKCPHCGGTHLTREEDTLDCWFDSGSSHIAALEARDGTWPADIYLEGGDQYRGWFQSSLLTSVALRGRAPYRAVLTNGWVLDGKGHPMHKSAGNVISPADLITKYGAEIMRLWAASSDYRNDVWVTDNTFKQLSEVYMKIRNTARYILGNLYDFTPETDLIAVEKLEFADAWAISKLNELIAKCREAYEKYEFHIIYHAVHNFCVIELSNFYFMILKDTLYCEAAAGQKRRSAQTAIWHILHALSRILSPLLSFTSEEIWKELPHLSSDKLDSVMLNDYPTELPVPEVDAAKWENFFTIREQVNKKLEEARADKAIGKSLEAEVTIPAQADSFTTTDLAYLLNVSSVKVKTELAVAASTAEKCPRCWTHTYEPAADGLCPRCASVVAG
jgi:isoleucyl-tRNA synthetase